MSNTNFFIVGKHPVLEALKNPQRKVLRLFLTEESKKNIHRISPKRNLIKDVKVFFKTKKELDKYCKNEQILHQGYVAEVEKLEEINFLEKKIFGFMVFHQKVRKISQIMTGKVIMCFCLDLKDTD